VKTQNEIPGMKSHYMRDMEHILKPKKYPEQEYHHDARKVYHLEQKHKFPKDEYTRSGHEKQRKQAPPAQPPQHDESGNPYPFSAKENLQKMNTGAPRSPPHARQVHSPSSNGSAGGLRTKNLNEYTQKYGRKHPSPGYSQGRRQQSPKVPSVASGGAGSGQGSGQKAYGTMLQQKPWKRQREAFKVGSDRTSQQPSGY
jgi:hypothetical protein